MGSIKKAVEDANASLVVMRENAEGFFKTISSGGSGGGGGGLRGLGPGGSQATRPAPGTPAPPLIDNLLDPMKRLFYPRLDSIGAQLQKLVDATKQSQTQEDSTTRASR